MNFRAVKTCFAFFLLLRSIAQVDSATSEGGMGRHCVVLLSDRHALRDRNSIYVHALGAVGFPLVSVDLADAATFELKSAAALVVPVETGTAIAPELAGRIVAEVRAGLDVVVEGECALARQLGVAFTGVDAETDGAVDRRHPGVALQWSETLPFREFQATGLTVFCTDRDSGSALMAGGRLGAGKWIYSAAPLDAANGWGYGRLPYFHEAFLDWFGLEPSLWRNKLIAYLDWADVSSQNPCEVATKLKEHGIGEIHLSAFYKFADCQDAFRVFVEACHGQGILVYAWLELPMLSADFWERHPEWREHTATDAEAKLDWRTLMALEIPACMKAVKAEIKTVIEALPWDGVDVAELYFESPAGFEKPEAFTPMSGWTRSEFQEDWGIDPIDFFTPGKPHYYKDDPKGFRRFLKYRRALCLRLNKEVVEFVQSLKCAPFGAAPAIVLTLVDVLIDPAMSGYIGIDKGSFMELQRQMGFELNVEDPFTLWSNGPDRYKLIGESYRKEAKPGSRLTVDINIVDREDTRIPNARQTGLEFLTLLHEAACALDQVCIYSASSPYPFDFKYAGAALAGNAWVKWTAADSCEVASPFSVLLKMPTQGKAFSVNGQPWPCVSAGGVLLPPGNSKVSVSRATSTPVAMQITDVNAEFSSCTRTPTGIALKYTGRKNVFVTLDRKPARVEVNGVARELPDFQNGAFHTLCCPAGQTEILFVEN